MHSQTRFGLTLIVVFKATKAVVALAAGTALLTSLHEGGIDAVVHHIAQVLHVAPESVARHVGGRTAAWGAIFLCGLAVLYSVEAVGLALRRRWAAWLTLIPTAALLPLELYRLVQAPHLIRLGLLLANAAVVWYLARYVSASSPRIPSKA
jgi:uncharacterized membrane protein (DUF2068 family)